jgi:serine/threonine-protein phosphatase 2A regulatory subunit B''
LKKGETIIIKIFYQINTNKTGKITLKEFKNSDFIDLLKDLESCNEINKFKKYFSYQDFYVLYSKFIELDSDNDFYLSESDLLAYDSYSLNPLIVNRVVNGYGRKLTSKKKGELIILIKFFRIFEL